MSRSHRVQLLGLLVALAIAAPLRSDGGSETGNSCKRITQALAAAVQHPVSGDEEFFRASSGGGAPASVMILLDNSGSMTDLPQCPSGWPDTGCNPDPGTPANPVGPAWNPTVSGSCSISTTSPEAWLESITPTRTYADPAYADSNLLSSAPPWSPASCAGTNNCLFDPDAYYDYGHWDETSATKLTGDPCTVTFQDGTGANRTVSLGADCRSCLDGMARGEGYYVSRVVRFFGVSQGRILYRTANYVRFKGTWLNANPPKFVAARRAIKDLLRIDPSRERVAQDFVRYGLTTFWNNTPSGNSVNNNNGGDNRGILYGDGASLLVPLGPDCAQSRDAVLNNDLTEIVAARQAIINVVNEVRTSGAARIQFENFTPLAESLFNIAQYFSVPGTAGAHATRFGAQFAKRGYVPSSGNYFPTTDTGTYQPYQDFQESSPGLINASWAQGNANQRAVCWSCQVNAAIVITDGAPNNESGLPGRTSSGDSYAAHAAQPAWDFQTFRPTQYWENCCPSTTTTANCYRGAATDQCGLWGSDRGSYLPLVAHYMNSNDFRLAPEPVPGATGTDQMAGSQTVQTHTVAFGITDAAAIRVLNATAALGGTRQAHLTGDYSSLYDALVRSVTVTTQRATSFSAASSNALQTNRNAATDAFFARFLPAEATNRPWEGHLIQATVFDEFAMGCDNTVTPGASVPANQPVVCGRSAAGVPITHHPNFSGRTLANGNNRCDGVYLVDDDCEEIRENAEGRFIKAAPGAGGVEVPARLAWDAGVVLATRPATPAGTAYRSAGDTAALTGGATARNIWTQIGSSRVDFTTANLATLRPAMALDKAFCAQLLADSRYCTSGCPTAASITEAQMDDCAKQVIYYVRGFDVMDFGGTAGCAGPLNSTATTGCTAGVGEERDSQVFSTNAASQDIRHWKLGDVFHSTPALVKPPIDELRCDFGFDTQCVSTLYVASSPDDLNRTPLAMYTSDRSGTNVPDVDAYERYRQDQRTRTQLVLAGANDGMLHAFVAGIPDPDHTEDPFFLTRPYRHGNASEQWAFIPPDLLPRLKFLLYGHKYMVDGSTMIRDVWVDGTSNAPATRPATAKDHRKQRQEFHTVAISTERSGGSTITALDVTDPAAPAFLWSFPPPLSDDARLMAESWSEFAPRPPPIGPVRIASATDPRGWEERWVAMLNGGYDPAMIRGRTVWMVDVWTGEVLWRYTNEDFRTTVGTSVASMFPVPAAVGMVDIGRTEAAAFDGDGFFDTATWADLGGNLFAARFHEPGTIDATTGRVSNWFAARAFEQQRRTDGEQRVKADSSSAGYRNEVFAMTANTFETGKGTLRTVFGTGNLERMMQNRNNNPDPRCGPDNLLSCCRSGCSSVTTSTVEDYGACSRTQGFTCTSGTLNAPTDGTTCSADPVCAAPAGNTYTSTTSFSFACGGITTSASGSLTCDANGLCSTYQEVGPGKDVGASRLTEPSNHNRFYGVWSYGGPAVAGRRFSTSSEARTFDTGRFTDVPFSSETLCVATPSHTCSLVETTRAEVSYDALDLYAAPTITCPPSTVCAATLADPGWFYEYGRTCPIATCSPAPPWIDEKTAAAPNILRGCVAWSGFRPLETTQSGTTTATDPCSIPQPSPSSYSYLAHFISGVPTKSCGFADNGVIRRASQRQSWSPPTATTVRVTIGAGGKIEYSTLQLDPGVAPTKKVAATEDEAVKGVYELEVSRQLHDCRHVSAASCP